MNDQGRNLNARTNARHWSVVIGTSLVILVCSLVIPTSAAPTTQSSIRIASLVPAVTDLLLGMNQRDKLVAISNWDPREPSLADLPRAGDYRTVDWEKLAQ